MSTKNFIPTLWHDAILTAYEKATVFGQLANRQFEREIKGYGDRVKINSIGDFTAGAYTPGSVTYQQIQDASIFLDVDNRDIVPVQINNIDEAQANPKVYSAAVAKMAYAMRDRIDQAVSAKYTEGTIFDGSSTGSPTSLTSATINSFMGEAGVALDDRNVPGENRVAVLPNWMAEKIRLGKIVKDTNNSAYLNMPSYAGEFAGFNVFKSNNITKSGTTWYAPMFFQAGETIALAEQLENLEVLKDKDYPMIDFVSLISVYGIKTVRPESLLYAYVANGAETTV